MKHFFITGGLGFIGTNLIPSLKQAFDCRITILDNRTNPSGDLELSKGIELIEGDIQNKDLLEEVISGHDAVIHLAADTRVIDSIDHPENNFHVNVGGTLNILECMRIHGIKTLINASTGGAIIGEVPPPVHEGLLPNPSSPYGASKMAVEGYCSAYFQSYGIKTISLRFSNIYGRYSINKLSVVAAFLKDIKEKQRIQVYGDGSQTRDYLFADDLVRGIIQAIIQENLCGVFQLGSGEPTSINQLIKIIKEVVPIEFETDFHDFRKGEVLHTYCDITKAKEAFQFNPTTTILKGIEDTWEWLCSGDHG